MKIYDYSSIKKLYVVGDIHGDFRPFFNLIKNCLLYDKSKHIEDSKLNLLGLDNDNEENEINQYNSGFIKRKYNDLYNDSVIIVCGDCGFGFNKFQYYIDNLTKINNLFSDTNTHIIFVRGNHDDPSYFSNELINMSNIKTVPDYSVIITEKTNTLCVGGAISVDRLWRKQQEYRINKYSSSKSKKLYWDDEAVVIKEDILSVLRENNINITSVVTHTCPSFSFPCEKDSAIGWLKYDDKLKNDLETERNSLTWLYEELIKEHKLYFWAYGHFHSNFIEYINEMVWIANADTFNIQSPMNVYDHYKEMERIKKSKKVKPKKKQTIPVDPNLEVDMLNFDVNIDSLIDANTLRHAEYNEAVERIHEELDNLIFNENNGVMVEEAPF